MTNEEILKHIPNINKRCLHYIFEDLKLQHKKNTLWLEFGVFSGETISYIASKTNNQVYGFDSFEGLPEKWRNGFDKGRFKLNSLPSVPDNVTLIKGLFQDTLDKFLENTPGDIGFIHLDADLYTSTKYVLSTLSNSNRLSNECIMLFDEIVNFPGFDSDTSELRALREWSNENPAIKWKWMGMNGKLGDVGQEHEQAFLQLI